MSDITVGIADIGVLSGEGMISTIGLGSSIGVIMADRSAKLAILGHFMLPDSGERNPVSVSKPAKYGDTCIVMMKEELAQMGGNSTRFIAKAAGGASLFRRRDDRTVLDVARKNIHSLIRNLAEVEVPLVADDVGGDHGRTIVFDNTTGILSVKSVNRMDPTRPIIKKI